MISSRTSRRLLRRIATATVSASLMVGTLVLGAGPASAAQTCDDGSRDSAAAIAKALGNSGSASLVTDAVRVVAPGAAPGSDTPAVILRYAAPYHCAWALISGTDGDTAWVDRRPTGADAWDGPLGRREIQSGNATTYTAAYRTAGSELRACGTWPQLGNGVSCTDWFTEPAAGSGEGASGPYIALGDSYSAGEGLAPFDAGTDTPTDRCHRSTQAYSQLMPQQPARFVACSMQTTEAFTTSRQTEPPQQDALDPNATLVTLTFGGNDLDWTSTLTACTKLETEITHNVVYSDEATCQRSLQSTPARIDAMRASVESIYETILDRSPRAQVRVLTYPPLFPLDRTSGGCRIARFHPLGLQAVIAADAEHQLGLYEEDANAAIIAAVNDVAAKKPEYTGRIRAVDVESQFGGYMENGHTISCGDTGRPEPWVNAVRYSLSQAARLADDLKRGNTKDLRVDLFDIYSASFHPTKEGQRQMYLALAATL